MPPRKKHRAGVLAMVDLDDLHTMVANAATRYERRADHPVLAAFEAFADTPKAARDMRNGRRATVCALLVLRSLERCALDTSGIPDDLKTPLTVNPDGSVTAA
jgi:hypothetical protein